MTSSSPSASCGGSGGDAGHGLMHTLRSGATLRWAVLLVILFLLLFLLNLAGTFSRRPKLAIVTASQDPYWDLVIEGAREAAARQNVRLTVIRPPSDEAEQTRQVEAILDQDYDGIAISPISVNRQTQLLTDIAGKSTLVTIDSDSPVINRLCFIGTDNYTAGRMCAEEVRDAVGEGGGLVIVSVGTLEKENGRQRRQGLIDELTGRSFERSRNDADDLPQPVVGGSFTIVTLVDDLRPEKARELATRAMREHPDVKCFVGLFAYSTPALLEALEQAGRLGEVKVVGFDVNEQTLAGIESGTVSASIMQDQYGCGFTAIRILADLAQGNRAGLPAFQMHYLGCDVVTKKNVHEVRSSLKHAGRRQQGTAGAGARGAG